jgi:hypothetical protein
MQMFFQWLKRLSAGGPDTPDDPKTPAVKGSAPNTSTCDTGRKSTSARLSQSEIASSGAKATREARPKVPPEVTSPALATARQSFDVAMSEFTDAGRDLVAQLARLQSLHVLTDSHPANGHLPGFAEDGGDRLFDTKGLARSEDAIRLMRQITFLVPNRVYNRQSPEPEGDVVEQKHAHDLLAAAHNIGFVTKEMRRTLNNLAADISDMAVNVFQGKPSPSERSRLLGIASDVRLDIASGLLAGGMDHALVAELSNLDADVIAAIAADLP